MALDRILSAVSTDLVTWQREPGVRLGFGWRSNLEMVNAPHVVRLPDARLRMYFYHGTLGSSGWTGGILSALSADALKWRLEPGIRVPNPKGSTVRSPIVFRDANGWKMLYVQGVGQPDAQLCSQLSKDGIYWRDMEPVRLLGLPPAASLEDVFRVQLEDGRVRLYLSLLLGTRTQIASAVSEGDSFRLEPGWRIPNQPGMELLVNNPCVFPVGGQWQMLFRGSAQLALNSCLYLAQSSDGLTWQPPTKILEPSSESPYERHGVGFPFLFPIDEGGWRLYYTGWWGSHWKASDTVASWEAAAQAAAQAEQIGLELGDE